MRLYITIEQKLYRFFINCICNNKVIEDGLMIDYHNIWKSYNI